MAEKIFVLIGIIILLFSIGIIINIIINTSRNNLKKNIDSQNKNIIRSVANNVKKDEDEAEAESEAESEAEAEAESEKIKVTQFQKLPNWKVMLDKHAHETALYFNAKKNGKELSIDDNGVYKLYITDENQCVNKFDYKKEFTDQSTNSDEIYFEFNDGYCTYDPYNSNAYFRYMCEGGILDSVKPLMEGVGGNYNNFYKGNGVCEINPQHCKDKGVDYDSSTKDCVSSDVQAFLEGVVGQTTVRAARKYHQDGVDLYRDGLNEIGIKGKAAEIFSDALGTTTAPLTMSVGLAMAAREESVDEVQDILNDIGLDGKGSKEASEVIGTILTPVITAKNVATDAVNAAVDVGKMVVNTLEDTFVGQAVNFVGGLFGL